MEEQKKEALEPEKETEEPAKEVSESGQQKPEDEQESSGKGRLGMQPAPTRSIVLWILAGLYLIYTGYTLCKNVLDGTDGGMGFLAAGVAFIVIGAALVILGIKNYSARAKAEQDAAENRDEDEEE